jgi:hypothetical protein
MDGFALIIKPEAKIDIKCLSTLSSAINLAALDEPVNRETIKMCM